MIRGDGAVAVAVPEQSITTATLKSTTRRTSPEDALVMGPRCCRWKVRIRITDKDVTRAIETAGRDVARETETLGRNIRDEANRHRSEPDESPISMPEVFLEDREPPSSWSTPAGKYVYLVNRTHERRRVTYERIVVKAGVNTSEVRYATVDGLGSVFLGSTCAFDVTYTAMCGSDIRYRLTKVEAAS
jgi:hypothetical protein